MNNLFRLRDGTLLAGKLSAAEVGSLLGERSVRGWLYLNPPSAPECPAATVTAALGDAAWAVVPVAEDALTLGLAEELVTSLEALPKPAMIHCSTATRASAVWALHAVRSGQPAAEVMAYAEAAGLKFLGRPAQKDWVASCIAAWAKQQ